MRRRVVLLSALLALPALPACNRTPEPEKGTSAPVRSSESPSPTHARPHPSPAASGPAASGPAEVAYQAPAAWTKADNPGPMRKATYHVPHAPGDTEDADLSVSQAGGSVDQNVARWALQLERKLPDVKRSERTVSGLKVTVVEIHGDYAGMAMPGGPAPTKKPGYALLGAIVETSPLTFFKLVGPEKTVAGAQRDFQELVSGLRVK